MYKPLADSTLLRMPKKEIIELLRLAEHNANVSQEWVAQQAENLKDWKPVVHGRWVDGKCSNCGVDIPTDDAHDAIFENECRFCYYCGAKMDGGADHEAN